MASSTALRTGASAQRTVGRTDDLPFDAYLNFKRKWPVMATFDFESLRTSIGSWGDMNGVLTNPNLLSLRPGAATGPRELRGLWLRVGQLQAPPPRNLSELARHLKRSQRKGLGESALATARDQRPTADGRCGHHSVRVATARAARTFSSWPAKE